VFLSSLELRQYAQGRKLRLHVSITDERLFAMAYAIAEAEEGA
jgi:phosphopantetheinyl transferase (holo-ACP synthase)